jgi:6-phosphogluconolactonase/glucosamine-6-phosphate isomerase/deaminase
MTLVFKKVSSIDPVADFIAGRLIHHLEEGKRVLWLVPGGSSIAIAAAVSHRLKGKPLSKLAVTLTDERHGEINHPDSNWRQLDEAGFELPGASLRPVLQGLDLGSTVSSFAETLKEEFDRADYRLGFFGIGPDGHTAGILPGSPAVRSGGLTAGYDAGNFLRLTMTPPAIDQLDEAVVYAVGEAKWPVIDALTTSIDWDVQPAQALKQVPRLTVFNDHLGENA